MNGALERFVRLGFFLVLGAGLVVVGCDSSGVGPGSDGDDESTTITGQVTDGSSAGSSAAKGTAPSKAGVEGATITAVRVHSDGTTTELDGEATTNADGEFTITVEGDGASSGVVQLDAEGENEFSSSVLVWVDGQSNVQAQPMTAETAAEADVYLEAKSEDGASSHTQGVTAADVAFYVTADVASGMDAGEPSSGDLAAAITSSVDAETQMNGEADEGAATEAVAEAKAELYTDLQSNLAVAESAEVGAQVVADFEDAMANLYVEAGGSAESQGQCRQASTSIVIEFSGDVSGEAAVGLRKQAELVRAEATARAEEALFEAQGASGATIDALAQARQQLKTDIRTASSVDAMVDAHSTYEAEVKSQMETTFGLSTAAIAAAETEIEGSLETLFTALAELTGALNGAADAAVNAYTSFYSNAQATAKSSFEATTDSEGTAEAAARALLFVSAQSHP